MNGKQFLIWHDLATYRGEGFLTQRHSHFFIQISLPDSGRVELRTRNGPWRSYAVAFIPSGVSHEMRKVEGNLTLLFLDPLTFGSDLFDYRDPTVFEVGNLFTPSIREEINRLLPAANDQVRPRALEILNRVGIRPCARLDGRIQKTIENADLEALTLERLSADAGLSKDRFRHLFRQETGIPFSAYRLWFKTKKAVDYLANHKDLLDASLEGGFADQAHFSRVFRRSFGIVPSDFTKKKDPYIAKFFAR